MNIFILFEFYIGQKPKDQVIQAIKDASLIFLDIFILSEFYIGQKPKDQAIKDASLIFLEEKIR